MISFLTIFTFSNLLNCLFLIYIMKATNLTHFSSSPAPDEWRQIPEIKKVRPKQQNVEISLQKIDKFNICLWMVGYGGVWKPASEFFHVKK